MYLKQVIIVFYSLLLIQLMKSIIIILVTFLVLAFAQAPIKQNLNKYEAYLQQWKTQYTELEVTQLEGFQQPGQMCNQKLCKFYYFTKRNIQMSKYTHRNMTVLLLGGLKGTDSLSQKVLLQSYGKLNAAKIIYFPIANPSGFLNGIDIALPSKINIESDFPILGNTLCNQSVAFKVLNHLFKKQNIDLTIYIHDGAPSFNYGWSNNYLVSQFPQEDLGIQIDISQMVRYIGNLDPEDGELKTGPLVDIKGGQNQSVIDWIYGASKYPKIISQHCNKSNFTSDPLIQMRGLVFSLKVGINLRQDYEKQAKNIKRAIYILNRVIEITNPSLIIKYQAENQISLSLNGCKVGSLTRIKLKNKNEQPIYEKQTEALIRGNVMYGIPTPTIIQIPSNIILSQDFTYQLQYTCGDWWVMKGQTRFSQLRKFNQSGIFNSKFTKVEDNKTVGNNQQIQTVQSIPKIKPTESEHSQKEEKEQEHSDLRKAAMIALGVIGILWMGVGIKHTIHILKTQRIKNFSQKFQSIERVQDLQAMESQNESSDSSILPELIEMKPNSQDLDQQRLTT